MTPLDTLLANNYLEMSILITLASVCVSSLVANKINAGPIISIMISVLSLPFSVIVSAIIVFSISVYIAPEGVISTVSSMPLGALAFFVETGVQFSALAFIIAPPLFLLLRYLGRKSRSTRSVWTSGRGVLIRNPNRVDKDHQK